MSILANDIKDDTCPQITAAPQLDMRGPGEVDCDRGLTWVTRLCMHDSKLQLRAPLAICENHQKKIYDRIANTYLRYLLTGEVPLMLILPFQIRSDLLVVERCFQNQKKFTHPSGDWV